jgi:hypothetical protein
MSEKYPVLIWSATASHNVTFKGARLAIGFGKHNVQPFPQDDNLPGWHDPNRYARRFAIETILDATTWTILYTQAMTRVANTTYPKLRVYDTWNAGAWTSTDRKVGWTQPTENSAATIASSDKVKVTIIFWERK